MACRSGSMPGVLGLAGLEGRDAALLDMLGGVEVGFAGGETTDVFTRRLQGLGLGIDRERR
jgi:hypothetical protein